MFKHNLTATLNLQRQDKNGCYPLRIRTTIQRKISYYPTGIILKVNQWDKKKKEIINHPLKDNYNSLLRKKMVELETQLIEAARNGDTIKKTKKKNADFFTFSQAKIKEQARTDKPGTTKHKQSDLNILRNFKPMLPFSAITTSFLHSYEDYCKKELGNCHNTIWRHMKFIRGMLNEAVKEGLYDKKLIADYKMPKYVDPEREYLVLSEVDKIEQFRNDTNIEKLRNVADWFLFSCYTGFRYEDVRTFTKERIKAGKILLRTSKKGVDVTLAIHPRLQKVLDRMPEGVYSNQKCNDYLKVIASSIGINKNLSMHIARHSHAVIFLDLGGNMEDLQKILGHQKSSVTQVYGKITNKRLDEAIGKTWGTV